MMMVLRVLGIVGCGKRVLLCKINRLAVNLMLLLLMVMLLLLVLLLSKVLVWVVLMVWMVESCSVG